MKKVYIIFLMVFLTSCSGFETLSKQFSTTDDINNTKINEEDSIVEIENDISNNYNYDKSDKLKMSMARTTTLNPLINDNKRVDDVLSLMFLKVGEMTEDYNVELVLGESYTYNPEENSGTLVLKDDVYWQNTTTPVDADDLIYSLNLLFREDNHSIYKDTVKDIVSYTKIDDRTVKFYLKEGTYNPYFLCFPIVPKDYASSLETVDGVHFENPIGDGYYYVSEDTVNGTLILKDYEQDSIDIVIDEIDVILQSEEEDALYSLESGILNFLRSDLSTWSEYHREKEVNILKEDTANIEFIAFNYDSIFKQEGLRKLVESSIDFNSVAESLFLDFCDFSYSLYPSNHFAYDENIIKPKFSLTKDFDYDYNGEEVIVLVNIENDERNKVATELVSNLKSRGINAVLHSLPFDQYINEIANKNFSILLGGNNLGDFDNFDFYFGPNNVFSYYDEDMNGILNNLYNAESVESYKEYAISLQEKINKESLIIPYIFKCEALISDININMVPSDRYLNDLANINRWEIN